VAKSKTIQDRILQFIAFLGISDREFCKKAELSSNYVATLKKGVAPGMDAVSKILSTYTEMSVQWLITGNGEMLNIDKPISVSIAREAEVFYDTTANSVSIPITDIKAAAGSGYMNTEVLRTSEFIQLPNNLTKKGKHLCIRIKGNSMSPTLQDGGFVVIRLLDNSEWKDLLSDRVYVVSDKEGKTLIKRVRNRFNNGFIVLTSDNPDKASYPNENWQAEDIVSIWYVEWYLSAKMPNIHDQFYSKVERMENSIDDLNRKFDELTRIELKRKEP
jgi:phage repressor protein C with HTH and peptisase S24 domain